MYHNYYATAQMAAVRHSERIARAEQSRLAAQFRARPQSPRRMAGAGQGLLVALRGVATRRTAMSS